MTTPAPAKGATMGQNVIGEVTESIHKFLIDNYDLTEQVPRFEEDLSFVPKDREEVVYIYMYRAAQNPNLKNAKRYRQAPVFVKGNGDNADEVFYHRPPLMMDLFYLVAVHAKFRSDAERLLGLGNPGAQRGDSLGVSASTVPPARRRCGQRGVGLTTSTRILPTTTSTWKRFRSPCATISRSVTRSIFSASKKPVWAVLTYRARVALAGPLVAGEGGTTIRIQGWVVQTRLRGPAVATRSGRMMGNRPQRRDRKPLGPDSRNLPGRFRKTNPKTQPKQRNRKAWITRPQASTFEGR